MSPSELEGRPREEIAAGGPPAGARPKTTQQQIKTQRTKQVVLASGHPKQAKPPLAAASLEGDSTLRYLSWLEMFVKVAFTLVPRVLTATIIAAAIPAAIRPYSIAVAPDSSLRNRISSVRT